MFALQNRRPWLRVEVILDEGVGRHPSVSTGAYFLQPMLFFLFFFTTMLINFSRSITTGFLRIRFLSSLSSYSD